MSNENAQAVEQELHELIERETKLYELLNSLLQEEQQALVQHNPMVLESIAGKKLAAMENIDLCDRRRTEILLSLGCENREAFLNWLAPRVTLLKIWNELEALCLRTQAINRLNGQLIAQQLSKTTEALDILMNSPQSTLAYGRDGGAHSAITGGRQLGKA